jgi:hypothetical protein
VQRRREGIEESRGPGPSSVSAARHGVCTGGQAGKRVGLAVVALHVRAVFPSRYDGCVRWSRAEGWLGDGGIVRGRIRLGVNETRHTRSSSEGEMEI